MFQRHEHHCLSTIFSIFCPHFSLIFRFIRIYKMKISHSWGWYTVPHKRHKSWWQILEKLNYILDFLQIQKINLKMGSLLLWILCKFLRHLRNCRICDKQYERFYITSFSFVLHFAANIEHSENVSINTAVMAVAYADTDKHRHTKQFPFTQRIFYKWMCAIFKQNILWLCTSIVSSKTTICVCHFSHLYCLQC